MSKALATKKVAAVLLGFGMVLAFAGSAAAQTTTSASTLSTLQAQVQALLAQIAALQGTGTATTGSGACFTFTQDEHQGSSGGQVMWVQEFLNGHGAQVAASGAGSPGNESSYFGALTKAAVMKFQSANGISPVSGYWGPLSRAKANAICAGSTTTGTGTGTGTTGTTGTGLTVTAGVQPANSLAPMNASRVPFTTFTLTNNSGAAVTITGITVQRTGLANDNAFAGVILVDSNGLQYGNAQTFNSNHEATVGGTMTLQAGQSTTFTVEGNMETTSHTDGGQVASISVVGVNTSVPVTGTLPITGASQTINETLTIGTAQVSVSSFDPDAKRNEPIGTTGVTFSGIRITSSGEDQKLYSITWNQTGSVGSTDLSNLATIVNGTSYPVTVDASGKYYTASFPGGILITKGNSVDAYIKGDITGSDASSRTIEFDIYRASDIYLVGQTYGYGVTPTNSSGTNNYAVNSNSTSGFDSTINPFYYGSTVTVTGGTLSTVSSASTVPPQNVGVNVPQQILGGFSTDFTGEPVTVNSVTVSVASSSNFEGITNATLVDQNGNVVAGPDDETFTGSGAGSIDFNSSITFPVGSMTYTIKGTVTTGSQNGSTVTLSTNPSTQWTGAVGQTSGATLSLTNSTITMSTMTVQPGALTVSAGSSPTASTITLNSNNLAVANIILDASASGEDVRINALPIIISATSSAEATSTNSFSLESNLSNCQLWNGTTVLNSQSIGSGQWSQVSSLGGTGGELSTQGVEANFIFDNSLTVPKGTTVTLTLECNVGGALLSGEAFSAGVDNGYKPTVTGATSGNSITPQVNTGTSGTMTIGTATISVSTPTQNYQLAAGGTNGVQVGSFTLQPTTGNVTLQGISLKLNSNNASSSDLQNGSIAIMNGSTQVGSVNFSGVVPNNGFYTSPTTTVNLSLPANQITTLQLVANLVSNTGPSGYSGHEILAGLNDAHGVSGNSSVDSGPGVMPTKGSGTGVFRSFPSVSQVTPSSASFSSDNLIEFSVAAANTGPVGIGKFSFNISSTTGVTVTNPEIFYGTSAGSPNTGALNGSGNATSCTIGSPTVCTTQLTSPLEIPAGTTWYFLLKAQSVANTTGATSPSITTTLLGDGLANDLAPLTTAGTTTYSFVWSPNSTTTSSASSNDWSTGYGLTGLASFGFSQTDQ